MARVFLNILIVLSLTLANALGKNQLFAKKKYSTYTVRKGDNLSTIAELFGVSVSKLCSWNDISREKVLFIGKRLRVKNRVTNSSDQRMRRTRVSESRYRVQYGDTLSEIAQRFGVSEVSVKRLNNLRRSSIYTGQRLAIPSRLMNSSHSLGPTASGRIRIQKPIYSRIFRRYKNSRYNRNLGLTYRVQRAKTVRAAHSGRIVKVSTMRGYGNYILVDHGKGWVSMYSNMSRVFVRPGQRIRMRSKLGLVKNTEFFFLLSFKGSPMDPNRYF